MRKAWILSNVLRISLVPEQRDWLNDILPISLLKVGWIAKRSSLNKHDGRLW
jgi:hypothetical protein